MNQQLKLHLKLLDLDNLLPSLFIWYNKYGDFMVEMKGKELRDELLVHLKEKVNDLPRPLGLAVIQVGEDEASKVYVHQKEKLAQELGYQFVHKLFREDIKQDTLIRYIKKLNKDDSIDGILVQMPLPTHLDSSLIQNTIDSYKDVDGLTFINAGRLVQGMPALIPCTPKGIVDLLDKYHIPLEGSRVVVIGRSVLVGKPMTNLLTNRNASVTLCHSKTKDVALYTKNADIIIVAVGKANYLKADMISPGAVVIDVGIHRTNGRLCGDVDYENVSKIAGYITPVPGGVGPMTVYELMHNVYTAYYLRNKYVLHKNKK